MYEIFIKLAQEHGVTAYKIAKETGISQQVFTSWKTGRSTPKQDKLKKIADYFGVSVDYLMTGEEPEPKLPSNIIPISKLKRKKVPMLGHIACGQPIFADENRNEYVLADEDIKADFCLTCNGDSMIGARINDGDIVFIQQADMVDNGEIAAVIIEDEATLKRVYYYPEQNKLILNAENSKYPPFVYSGEELDHIRILGRAVAFQSVIK